VDVLHFVLDHNFPPLPDVTWPDSIKFSRLIDVDARLIRDYDDWQVLLALHQRGDVDAFVTQDAAMLSLATEMVALSRLRLCLVVTKDTGQSPMRALGLLMAGLDTVANHVRNERRRIVELSLHSKAVSVDERLNRIALHQRVTPPDLRDRELAKIGDIERQVLSE